MSTVNNGVRELTVNELDVVSGAMTQPFSFAIGYAKFTVGPNGWEFWNGSCKVGDQNGTGDAGCPTPK
jgi:hypothetical protein